MWISILQLSLFFEEIEAQLVNMQFVTWAASFTLLQLLTASYWSFINKKNNKNSYRQQYSLTHFFYRFHSKAWTWSPQPWEGVHKQTISPEFFTWNPSQWIHHTSYHWCDRLNIYLKFPVHFLFLFILFSSFFYWQFSPQTNLKHFCFKLILETFSGSFFNLFVEP